MNGLVLKFSFDDGYKEDLRVAALLEKYGFTATFYIPNCTELHREEIQQLSEKHEIGGHTVTHPMDMKLLDPIESDREITENKKWLENIIGRPISEFCYPRGRYDEDTIESVRRAGFTTARTTKVGTCVAIGLDDQYAIPTSVHIFDRKEYNGVPWPAYARTMFDNAIQAAKQDGTGYFHLWGHSKIEIEKFNWWDEFESLLKYIHENLSPQQ